MAYKKCGECKTMKDTDKDFYSTNGRICKECKKNQVVEHKKAVGGKVVDLLEKLLEGQENMDERMREMEENIEKIRKKLKKISTE